MDIVKKTTPKKKVDKKPAAKKSCPFLKPFSKDRGGSDSYFFKTFPFSFFRMNNSWHILACLTKYLRS
jgi:hypothetical protein